MNASGGLVAPVRERDEASVLPTRDDPFARASCEGLGGPAGRRVGPPRGWWTPVRVLVALTLATLGLGVLSKGTCYDEGWQRSTSVQYVHACYSDLPHLFRERGLAQGLVPYVEAAVEYPVLTGALMGVTAVGARALGGNVDDEARRFFLLNSVVLAGLAALTVLGVAALAGVAGRRRWDAVMLAVSPALALTATINWDLLAVALVTGALLAWARSRPGLAGVMLGFAVSAKFYPLVLLGPLLLLALRAGRLGAFVRTLAAAVLTWGVVNLPVAAAATEDWALFYTFSADRQPSFGSPWYWYVNVVGPLDVETVNRLGTLSFVVLALGIAVLALTAPQRPRLASLAFLTVAAFCLVNKVYSPQFLLWLLPLAVLARPRWRDLLIWQACELAYFVAVWYHLASFTDSEHGLPQGVYWLALWLHVAGTVYVASVVVRDVWRSDLDPVRADGTDDPAGGVLDGADDVLAWAR